MADTLTITVPQPEVKVLKSKIESHVMVANSSDSLEHLISPDKFSSFHHSIAIHRYVLSFVNELKYRLKQKLNEDEHLITKDSNHNLYDEACKQIIARDQQLHFPDIIKFFHSDYNTFKEMPNLVKQYIQ